MPGSAKARLLDAAARHFETGGFAAASVIAIAKDAGLTTGSLYHHFESKLRLFLILRQEMERRIRDRMEGAAAGAGGDWPGVVAALLVGFDAAVRFRAARILSETAAPLDEDLIEATLMGLGGAAPPAAARILAAAWRGALAAAAEGVPHDEARAALAWTLNAGVGATPLAIAT